MQYPEITSYGLEMQAKTVAGTKVTFTRIEVGDGTKPSSITNLNALVSPKKSVDITSYKSDRFAVTFTGTYKTSDITASFTCREVGLYAKAADDNVEHLYAYYNYEDNAYNVVKNTSVVVEEQINMIVAVGNSENIQAVVSVSSVYATKSEVESKLDDNVVMNVCSGDGTVSLQSGITTELCTINLDPGIYVVNYSMVIENASGVSPSSDYVYVCFTNDPSSRMNAITDDLKVPMAVAPFFHPNLQGSELIQINTKTKFYLYGRSTKSCQVSSSVKYIRIK